MKSMIGTMTLLIATAVGCKKADEPVEPAGQPAAAAEEHAGLTDGTRSSMETVLVAYEQVRAGLAADQLESALQAAARIETSAREAAGKAPPNLRPHLDAIAGAATRLKGASKDKPDEVRRLFGEVSRHVLELLVSERSLASGRYIFECPMAQGYKKWVQPSAEISNPYMGTRMPRCGSESRLEP